MTVTVGGLVAMGFEPDPQSCLPTHPLLRLVNGRRELWAYPPHKGGKRDWA